MQKYQRLTMSEREEISRYSIMNYSYRQIAYILERCPSTIYREIYSRGFTQENYRAIPAQRHMQVSRISHRSRKLEQNQKLQQIVVTYLGLRWSPEQIAKRLKILYPNDMSMRVSHETIYAYLYVHPRGHLKHRMIQYLRRKHSHRHIQNRERKRTHALQDFVSIDERPTEVSSRKIAGHWEGDLIMGPMNRSAIGTLVERTTRMTFIVKLKDKDAATVRKAFAHKLNRLPAALKKSLTYDQGQEMAEHKTFTQDTKIQVYFAHPHSPWERGTSENTNALVRDFFQKGTDFSKITSRQLNKVEHLLNERPRKVLNFYTPNEAFTKVVALET